MLPNIIFQVCYWLTNNVVFKTCYLILEIMPFFNINLSANVDQFLKFLKKTVFFRIN